MSRSTVVVTPNGTGPSDDLAALIPPALLTRVQDQRSFPALAKDGPAMATLEQVARRVPTTHDLFCADSRRMQFLADESVHLVLTSPPYWTLKEYPKRPGQLGWIQDYEQFLQALSDVWHQALRVLVPGGRLVIVVGDVCLPRRRFGRHSVFPLHASIQEQCRQIGFDNLAPIIWHKIANAQLEVENGSRFLGKPYEPNAIVKNDIEYILFQRKRGGYRNPTKEARILSLIPEKLQRAWFQQIWTVGGSSTRLHPAPYALTLAERLIRMFSFVGDTVLDPFMGTGTTNLAAANWGRNSIGIDIEPGYFRMARERIQSRTKELKLALV